jgi:capsular exopolysaccharide synthesis family protein
MRNPLTRYILLAKQWGWLIVLGVVLCGGTTYVVTKLMHPVYQATATLFLSFNSTSPYESNLSAIAALPTYALLVTNPQVLQPVVAQHPGLTLKTLLPMVSVKPQSNTEVIEVDVNNTNPQLAAQLANQISQSFAQYANTQLSATIQVLPATVPTDPLQPKPSLDALLGAVVGLGLSLGLIIAFEWIDDRMENPDDVQDLLQLDLLTVIPYLSEKERVKNAEDTPGLAEGCRILCASLNGIQEAKPFKLVMVTSALAGEGKSTVAANLASFMAMAGKRVLLVDADLRHPVQDQHFQLDNRQGLSNAFLEMWAQVDVKLNGQQTEIPTLNVLTAGVLPSNPSELLQSQLAEQLFAHLKRSSQFDYVILDSSPLLPVADAQILATHVDAVLLVVDISKTPRKVLLRAKQALQRTRTRLLGITVNKSRWPDYGDQSDYLGIQLRPKMNVSFSIPDTLPEKGKTNGKANGKMKIEEAATIHLPSAVGNEKEKE